MGQTAPAQDPLASTSKPRAQATVRPIRVLLQQAALPRYRVPVFRELARRPGIDLELVYSTSPGLPNAEPDGFRAEHVEYRRLSLGGQEFMWHPGQFRYVSGRHADVAILSWNTRYLSLIPGLLRARLLGIPVVLWGHGYSKAERAMAAWARRVVARLARAVVFYNHTAAEAFIAAGFPSQRVFVALNSLDQGPIRASREHWLARPQELRAFQESKGLAGRKVVLFVSRLDPGNRVSLLLEAADELRRRMPELLVLVVGKGEEGDALRAMVEARGLHDHVRLLGAIYQETELGAYFVSARVFCYPRNIGLSILHAFGYAQPVVTGDDLASHNPEIEALRPGENGLTYKDGDASDLARVLERVLTDDALRERLSQGAQRTVTERFSVEKMVDGFEAAIRHCVPARA